MLEAMRWVVAAFFVPWVVLGCSSKHPVEKSPTPPDMQPLIDVYNAPTGTLDQQTFDSFKQQVLDHQSLLDQADLDQIFTSALDVSIAGDADAGTSDAGVAANVPHFEGSGYVTATRICGDWSAGAKPDPANGNMRFTLTFTEKGPGPIVWGSFNDCSYDANGVKLKLGAGPDGQTGQVSADFGSGLSFSGYDGSPVLFSANLLAEVNGQPYSIDFDFRIKPATRELELRVPVSDGDVIVELSTAGFAGLRAGNGTFSCDGSTHTCTADTGVSITF